MTQLDHFMSILILLVVTVGLTALPVLIIVLLKEIIGNNK